MFRPIIKLIYRALGWKLVGPVPTVPKAIWVIAPHNTNWDLLLGIGARAETGVWIQYLAKKEIFTWYAGWLFRFLGGKPVDRKRATNLVTSVVDIINSHDTLHICITPEGTRGNVSKLKMGFYYMALRSGVPLILTGFDYDRKAVVLSEPLYLTGDYQKDMLPLYEFFLKIGGRRKDWLQKYADTGVIETPAEMKR